MRKLYFTLSFIFCVNILAFSQSIKETIPEFAESLFNLNKIEIKTTLTNRGFSLLSKETLSQFGYDAKNVVAGYGNYQIWCIICFDNKGSIEKILVNNVKYTSAQNMISEYTSNRYVEDEENSTRQELVFVKRNKKYTYAAFVNFMVNPYSCITKTEFRRAVKK